MIVTLAAAGVSPAVAITGAVGKLGETSAAAARVDELITTPGVRPQTSPDEPEPAITSAEVRSDALTVRYPGTTEPAVRDLDLDVDDGELVAIVGASGAGKSTIALALTRLIAEESGRISIGDVDVARLSPERTREHVVLVGQHTHIFHASVRENLLLPAADDVRIWEALTNARLAERIRRLPRGLDTVLSERGADLSGGERQRLGLARGLLRSPDVLILDEPTAGLDPNTEAEFLSALAAARRNRTTIVVTHRASVMAACDRVAVLAAGTIVATGRHDDLIVSSPHYRELHGSSDDDGATPS
ncbi:amino acid ABC transporter ATP-binding/permease protein [Gordonia sp. NPDC003504]